MNTVTHQALVRRTKDRHHMFVAVCNDCGWRGKECYTKQQAQKWATKHERTGR